mmetsp:Transcript_846/g.1803  ORF Transcript_846/g.1803 Transcript_846/m.1803 type:complete len:156 (+) Transcript_846:73-540(+)
MASCVMTRKMSCLFILALFTAGECARHAEVERHAFDAEAKDDAEEALMEVDQKLDQEEEFGKRCCCFHPDTGGYYTNTNGLDEDNCPDYKAGKRGCSNSRLDSDKPCYSRHASKHDLYCEVRLVGMCTSLGGTIPVKKGWEKCYERDSDGSLKGC